jgi:very-short-patch-repair endonuclease
MTFQLILKSLDLPAPVTEHRFHVERKWRFDFAWPDLKVAVEVEGGIWTGGRHTRGAGFLKDMEKYNHAAAAGWCVLRCTPTTLMSGPMLDLLARVLGERLSKVAV